MSQKVDEKKTNATKKLIEDLQNFLEKECVKHNYTSTEIYASIIYLKMTIENILEQYYGAEKFMDVVKSIKINNTKAN